VQSVWQTTFLINVLPIHLLHAGFLLDWFSTLKTEVILSSETSVRIWTSRSYIPEDGNIYHGNMSVFSVTSHLNLFNQYWLSPARGESTLKLKCDYNLGFNWSAVHVLHVKLTQKAGIWIIQGWRYKQLNRMPASCWEISVFKSWDEWPTECPITKKGKGGTTHSISEKYTKEVSQAPYENLWRLAALAT
jgi:hypothetical protein